jgi:hypothetical protein
MIKKASEPGTTVSGSFDGLLLPVLAKVLLCPYLNFIWWCCSLPCYCQNRNLPKGRLRNYDIFERNLIQNIQQLYQGFDDIGYRQFGRLPGRVEPAGVNPIIYPALHIGAQAVADDEHLIL